MGFNKLLNLKNRQKKIQKSKKVPVLKSLIGIRKIGEGSKIYEVELLNSQKRNPIFKGGSAVVEIHLVRDVKTGDHHFRIMETSHDDEGNFIGSEFLESKKGNEKFSTIEEALEKALLSHEEPLFSGMNKTWIEEIPSNEKQKKMFLNGIGNTNFFSVQTIHPSGKIEEMQFPTEESAHEYFLI